MKKYIFITLISLFVLTPWSSEASIRIDKNDINIRSLSFSNPYTYSGDCPVEIRVEYDFSLVFNNGEITSHCGIQETTLMPLSTATIDLRRGSPANNLEARLLIHNIVIYVTNGGYVYQFYYDQTGQVECGGNCLGMGSNYCVNLSINNQSVERIAYSLWYGFWTEISRK
jgi:hypothetical protein